MLTQTEENYLKALHNLTCNGNEQEVTGTNQLAKHLNVRPATANDMLKKLKDKSLVVNSQQYEILKIHKIKSIPSIVTKNLLKLKISYNSD